MNTKEQLRLGTALFLGFFSFIGLSAQAQHAGAAPIGEGVAPRVLARPGHSRPVAIANSRPTRANMAIPGSPFGSFGAGNFGPGMAFAPSSSFGPGLGIEAAIDPATQWRIATAERLFRLHPPIGGVGYYLLTDGGYGYDYEVPQDDQSTEPPQASAIGPGQQPIIVVEQAAPQGNNAEQGPVAAPEPPLPDVGHFTLVLRNGQKIAAIAFAKRNGKIIYVTPDGDRKTMSAGDLDVKATKELNEERGTPLKL